MNIRRIVTAAVAMLSLMAGIAVTAGSASAAIAHPAAAFSIKPWTVYYEDIGAPWTATAKPATIYFGAGGSFIITDVDWRYQSYQGTPLQWWGHTSAEGFGTLAINNCVPNCAEGHYAKYPITLVELTRVHYHDGQPYFSLMTLDWVTGNTNHQQHYNLGAYGPS